MTYKICRIIIYIGTDYNFFNTFLVSYSIIMLFYGLYTTNAL